MVDDFLWDSPKAAELSSPLLHFLMQRRIIRRVFIEREDVLQLTDDRFNEAVAFAVLDDRGTRDSLNDDLNSSWNPLDLGDAADRPYLVQDIRCRVLDLRIFLSDGKQQAVSTEGGFDGCERLFPSGSYRSRGRWKYNGATQWQHGKTLATRLGH